MLKHNWFGTVSFILLKSYRNKVQAAVTAGRSVVIQHLAVLEGETRHEDARVHSCILGNIAC